MTSKADVAIAYARAQLGKPYRFGATGPDAFDCSGLTMMAYKAAGIDMPHASAAQGMKAAKVTYQLASPGDLVFFGDPAHHVALYLGGAMMIAAPHTGDVVKIQPVYQAATWYGRIPGMFSGHLDDVAKLPGEVVGAVGDAADATATLIRTVTDVKSLLTDKSMWQRLVFVGWGLGAVVVGGLLLVTSKNLGG
jgi:hypothetical protein